MTVFSINPATGERVADYTEQSADEIETILEGAHEAYRAWRTTGFAERAARSAWQRTNARAIRVTLIVDRYYLPNGSQEAIVDLGTPQGVDNVDAYRLMIESFKWR